MYKVDAEDKQLIPLTPKSFGDLGVMERFDIQEWIEKTPSVLGQELLVIAKELPLPSGIRLDLLAIDKQANLVIIELKRGESGRDVEWQAIKYASYCSNFLPDEIFTYYAQYLQSDTDEAQLSIEEFIDEELDNLNQSQQIILVANEFHPDVVSAVLWLRDYGIEIKCIRLRPYIDNDGDLFITPDVIIPLPEAKDYLERKEAKQKEARRPTRGSFSLEKGAFEPSELEQKLKRTLARETVLTPRLVRFIEILLSEDRVFDREEVKQKLFEKGVGSDIGQTGRYLSNISQFLTKKSNPHLRQVIEFETGGAHGQMKDNYKVILEHRELLSRLIEEWNSRQTAHGWLASPPAISPPSITK
ncbi:MAG: DNA repair protein MmcB-related protein [Anaerolineales bacterium]|nr:MAG: DNA repair protein MmcB-related protein [Anaerolineales bacterium]